MQNLPIQFIKSLSKQLTDFGLNPMEWSIIKNETKFYAIYKWDSDFKMSGEVEVDKSLGLKWKRLQLVSF